MSEKNIFPVPRATQQKPGGSRVEGMRMRGRQNQRAQIGPVEPERQFAADDTAGLAGAAAGDDFDTAQMVGDGAVQEALQRMERRLRGLAVQIQRPGGTQLAALETVPR